MLQKIIPAVINATRAAGAKTSSSLNKMSTGFDKTVTIVQDLTTKAENVSSLSKKINTSLAQYSINRSLGKTYNYQTALEECRQQLVDPLFQNVDFLRRMHLTYVPSKFPSGDRIVFKKSQMNLIDSCLKKNKKIKLEFMNENGETINAVFIPKKAHLGEECHRVAIRRTLPSGASESVTSSYFPKSSQIRVVETNLDGSKRISSIFGTEESAKIKTAAIPSNNSNNAVSCDKFAKITSKQ